MFKIHLMNDKEEVPNPLIENYENVDEAIESIVETTTKTKHVMAIWDQDREEYIAIFKGGKQIGIGMSILESTIIVPSNKEVNVSVPLHGELIVNFVILNDDSSPLALRCNFKRDGAGMILWRVNNPNEPVRFRLNEDSNNFTVDTIESEMELWESEE